MAFPTLSDLVVKESYVFVLKKGSNVLGQIRSVQPQAQGTVRQHARIGDVNQKSTAGPNQNTVTIEVYVDDNLYDLARVLGIEPPGGGWTGSETIKLNPSVTAYDLTIEQYDVNDSTGTLKAVWTLKGCTPSQFSPDITADSEVTAQIQVTCEDIYVTPQ